MPTPTAPPKRVAQRRGTIIAVAVALFFIGLLAWFIARGGKHTAAQNTPAPEALLDPTSASAEHLHLDLTDKNDPKRQAGELLLAKMEPLPAGHYAVDAPEAYLFMRDGRTIYIRGDSGRFYMPATQPESGTLTGHILIEAYDRRADGKRIDRAIDKPGQTLTTDTLSFNTTLGEVSTPDAFRFTSAMADCTGTGLEIIINQLRDRLEQMRIKQNGTLTVKRHAAPHQGAQQQAAATPPGASAPGAGPVTQPLSTTAATGPSEAAPAQPPIKPIETIYRVVVEQSVVVHRDQGTIKSDELHAWARLIDNKLPQGAIGTIRIVSPKSVAAAGVPAAGDPPAPNSTTGANAPVPATPIANSPTAPATAQASTPAPAESQEPEIVLTWAGPCTITPLAETPAELKNDHVALRFTSPKSGLVELADPARNASGHAATIDYAATTRRLTMAGPGPASVLLALPEAGESLEAIRLEMDLASGLAHIPGPGVLARLVDPKSPAANRQQVSWTDQADFTFETHESEVVQALKQAVCQGTVKLTDKSGTLKGQFLRADFATLDNHPSSLTRLIVHDNAVAESETSDRLAADKLDVAFRPGAAGDPEPTALTADGHVSAKRRDASLTSNFLEATLAKGPTGHTDVTSAHATGAVQFADKSRDIPISAAADEMVADLHWLDLPPGSPPGTIPPRVQRVDLIGDNATIARGSDTTIHGTQMRVDGVARRLEVFGKGNLLHNDPTKPPAPGPTLTASWTSSMTFDDSAGSVDCVGEVSVTSWPEPLVRDQVDAERIKLVLTPEKAGTTAAGKAPDHQGYAGVRTARAFGSILEFNNGVNARVESIRFAQDPEAEGGLRQEQVYYAEGPMILADNDKGTLDIPDRGRMVLVDRRSKTATPANPASPAAPTPSGDARGDSLFDWDGSMHMARDKGTIDMDRNVRLTHRSMDDGQVTNLVCEHLSAATRTAPPAASPSEPQGPTGLIRATAEGAVYAASGPEASPGRPFRALRELIADRADYDALKRQIQATATDSNQVTIFDAASGSPQSAASLLWDLGADRITVSKPSPMTGSH